MAFSGPLLMRGSAASTEANTKLNLAAVGIGGQGHGDMSGMLSTGRVNVVALCDTDAAMLARGKKTVVDADHAEPKCCDDYRRLLDNAATFDAVLIATPDHWHAPLCKAFMKAGKHIYCEKPLAHSLGEARELRELARTSKVVTQMGNQGSASTPLRRCIEVIQAGALGQIQEVHSWGLHSFGKDGNAKGEDPIPEGFNWDLWVGPSAMRPFVKDVYHPKNWRGWYDFGNGSLMDFWCHDMNLPVRALNLSYPERVVINFNPKNPWDQTPGKAAWEYYFPARGTLAPVKMYWQGGGKPPAEVVAPLAAVNKQDEGGVMIIGEKGRIYTDHWGYIGLILLDGEPRLKDILHHPATAAIPETLPRAKGGHSSEWIDAIYGKGRTFSDFDTGGKLTEIGLAGALAHRVGKNLDWDGEKMEARNAPEASRFIHPELRTKWQV